MPDLLIGLGAILLVALLGFVVYLAIQVSRRHRSNLDEAARRFDGSVTSSFWNGSGLEWTAEGIPARLRYFAGTDKAPPWTRLQFQWAPSGTLRVVPEGFFARLRKYFGAEDIQVGDAAFDEKYLIQGSPTSWVREALDPEVRRGLETLSGLGASFWRGSGIRLDAGPTGVTIFCYRNLVDSRDELLGYIGGGVAILRRLRTAGSSSSGVLSVESAAAEGRCPVCGQSMEEELHRCGACLTLHHEDCWTYFGGCAIYACSRAGGTRLPAKK